MTEEQHLTALDRVKEGLRAPKNGNGELKNPDMLPAYIFDMMGKKENAQQFTEWSAGQATYFARLQALSDMLKNFILDEDDPNKKFDLVFCDSFCQHYAVNMQSLDRKSRIEARDMGKQSHNIMTNGTLGTITQPVDPLEAQRKPWYKFWG